VARSRSKQGKVRGKEEFETDGSGTIVVDSNPTMQEDIVEPEEYGGGNEAFDYAGGVRFDQPSVSFSPAPSTSKSVIDWSEFWLESKVPVLGYDVIDNKVVILKGADHSVDSSKDVIVYDFITGTFTRGDTKFSGSTDISNMITDPETGELVATHISSSAGSHLKRFKAHQAANISSSTVNIVTPFFDFGSSGQKKRLYKVEVLARGTNLDDLDITAAYDGNARASYAGYSDIFSGTGNTFANTTALDWDKQTFTVTTPTDFNSVSIRIYATGAMTTADWGISEITFIYREKGIR